MQPCSSYQQNQIAILLLKQVHKTLFRTQNSTLSNNDSHIIQFIQLILITFKMSKWFLKNNTESIHMVHHSGLFLSQMPYMDTLSQTLSQTLFLYFTANQMELPQCNLSILALGQKISAFCAELGFSLPLTCIPFFHNSGSLLFCFTDVSSWD